MPQSEDEPVIPASSVSHARRLLRLGVATSSAYLTALGIYAWTVSSLMLEMTPDEFATFLSGAFAPLGFLWLVLGFRQQGDELQNSARALWLQGEELRNSVEQQRQLVEVSREQLAYEVTARLESEVESERAAQPRLVAAIGIRSYSGLQQTFNVTIHSGGPTCSDVVAIANGMVLSRKAVIQAGEKIDFQISYQRLDEIVPIMLLIQYTDSNGNRRQQQFYAPITENGGPNDGKTLGDLVGNGIVEKI